MHSNITQFEDIEQERQEVVTLSGLRTKGGAPVAVLVLPIEAERFALIMQALPGPRPQVGPKVESVDVSFLGTIAKPLVEASAHVMRDGERVPAFSWSGPSLLPVSHLSIDDLTRLMSAAMRVSGWDVEGEKGSSFLAVHHADGEGLGHGVGAGPLRKQARNRRTRGAPRP